MNFEYSVYSEQDKCNFCKKIVFEKMKKCKECKKRIICKCCYKQEGGLCEKCDEKYQKQVKLYFGDNIIYEDDV